MNISEDFMEHLYDGALAIEVYGHKQSGDRKNPALWDLGIIQAKTRSLRDRYMWEIHLWFGIWGKSASEVPSFEADLG